MKKYDFLIKFLINLIYNILIYNLIYNIFYYSKILLLINNNSETLSRYPFEVEIHRLVPPDSAR